MKAHKSYIITRPQRLLRDGLLASAQRYPNKEALVVEGQPYTYTQLFDAAMRLAAALNERGLERGDRVAVYMDNSWPCVVSIYAVLLAGGVFLAINPQTKTEKLEFILDDSDTKFLITDPHLEFVYSESVKNTKKLISIIASSTRTDSRQLRVPIESFDEVLENTQPLDIPVEVIPNDLAALIYTSGSTGFPKGVMLTHQAMVFAAWSLIEYQRLSERDRIMLVLPIAFDYGLYQLLMAMKLGATLIMERSFTFPAQIYKRMLEQQATVFPGVPTIFAMMISTHKKKKLSFPYVTRVTNTAAALPVGFIQYLKEIFPHALIFKMYGLTECKRVAYLEPELVDEKPASVGKAIPGTEVYLLSLDGGSVSPGEEGILHVRGPHVMVGYWKNPNLTEKMLKPGKLPGERVLCTQDWFRIDEEGFLYFIGRSDDIIKTRGEKISPAEVENVLQKITGVEQVAVIGINDSLLGQAVRAFIVPEPGADLDEKKIKRECLMHLENFMVPRDVIFLAEMPITLNGKIDKSLLSEIAPEKNVLENERLTKEYGSIAR